MGSTALPELARAQLPLESPARRLFTQAGVAVDSGLVYAVRFVVERALIPDVHAVSGLKESMRPLESPELADDPRHYFAFVDGPFDPLVVSSRVRRRLRGGAIVARKLASDYRPYHRVHGSADAPEGPGPVVLEHWKHKAGARGTVVALHGFAMGRPRLDAPMLFASQWYDLGLDVVLLTLPHHGVRAPRDARFSGESFAVSDATRLSEAMREAVYEILLVQRWLRAESDAPVGLLGLSLGGYLTALSVALADDFDFAVPIVPPACMGDLAWRFFEQTRHARRGGRAALTREELRRAFRLHSPLAHPLRTPAEKILIVGGRGDRVVPPEHPHALWKHWGEPRIHWFSGSHLAPFGRAGVVAAVGSHLRRLGVL